MSDAEQTQSQDGELRLWLHEPQKQTNNHYQRDVEWFK